MSGRGREETALNRDVNPLASLGKCTWAFHYRGALGGLILIPASILTSFSAPTFAPRDPLNLAFDLLGWGAFLGGTALRLWATGYVGGRKRRELVTEGPYSLCRNPLY